ncbi:MAG: VTT domain-containing protein [Candidatus Omnitrophica bacterium]|jgi:uncharacterized membrane protein YdjX (TVP38/TMEM64 family)|nr:VTT domain-containing protein [Candidatus Omnitrophota bacterium]
MEEKNKFKKILAKAIAVFCLIGVIVILGHFFSGNLEKINTFLKKTPLIYSSLVFIMLYVLANFVVFWDVKDLLKPVAAVIFGAYLSTLFIYIAEIINAFLFFNISKILGRDFVEKILKGKFKNFYENLENISFSWIFMLRLLPLIPYRVLDAGFGLSKVSFRKYLAAVILASPPRIFWIQFIMASVGGFSFEKIMQYYQKNSLITFLVLIYFIISIVIAFKWKNKFK